MKLALMTFEERRYCVLSSLCCLQEESDSIALAALTLNTDCSGRGKGQVESPGRPVLCIKYSLFIQTKNQTSQHRK